MNSIRPRYDVGLLVLRLVTGLIFLAHGYQKTFTMGLGNVGHGFDQMGIPMGQLMGPFISILELVGGIALILGIFTRGFAVLFICDMLGAIAFVHFKNGFFLPTGFEFPLLLAVTSLAIALCGAGDMSIDARMHKAPTGA
jgi:putative oxidoreductase